MRTLLILILLCSGSAAKAEQLTVAVAANFTASMQELAASFEQSSGHSLRVSYGSTGKLYAQILQGAPYSVFLSADQQRPAMLHEAGLGEPPFTYAIGRLALWSPDPKLADKLEQQLRTAEVERLAIANPKTAPYGAAAMQVLQALGVDKALRGRLVRGDNIAQTYQFVFTGNVPMGFIAASQLQAKQTGAAWLPPQSLYTPIRQDAILLNAGRQSAAVQEFVAFLQSDAARTLISAAGYGLD